MKKRILTALLAVCMTVTTIGMDAQAYNQEPAAVEEEAEEISQPEESQEEPEETAQPEESQEEPEETVHSEESQEEPEETAQPEETTQPEGEVEKPRQQVKETTKTQEDIQNPQQEAALNYLLIEKDNMEIPDTQNIVASLGKKGAVLSNAKLIYQNETTGEEFTVEASQAIQDMVLFSVEFKEAFQKGSYVLKTIVYAENGVEQSVSLSEADMNVRFGVNTKVEAEPDDVLINEELLKEVEANVITMDGNGNTVSENTIGSVLDNTEASVSAKARTFGVTAERGAKKNLVVVLDPGHDDTHGGASYFGAKEQDLVLKIAKYCRDELKKYSGITVYMVRDSQACPYGGWAVGASSDCNAKRVEFAAGKGADVYVSFHLNASPSSVPQGVGIYYPNSNYRPDIGQESQGLATEIFNKLNALGLADWAGGTLIRNSGDGTTYPDGSLADYLGVIRRSKLAGIPAVLIEHAFLSNYSDYMNFLSSDAKLKNLGVADANAIASYYKLNKGTNVPVITTVQSTKNGKLKVVWPKVSGAASYQLYKSKKRTEGFVKVATVAGSSYTDRNVKTGVPYYYKIRVVYSNSSVGKASTANKGTALAKSTVNYVQSKKSKRLNVNWKTVPGAEGYRIYRSTTSIGGFQQIKDIKSGKTTSYADTVPKNNARYYYKVRAYNYSNNRLGGGAVSSSKYGFVLSSPKTPAVETKSDETIEVKWNHVNRARGYVVVRSTKKGSGYKKVGIIKSGNILSYKDTSVKPGQTYYYMVRATNNLYGVAGSSGYSDAMSGKTISKTSVTHTRSKIRKK